MIRKVYHSFPGVHECYTTVTGLLHPPLSAIMMIFLMHLESYVLKLEKSACTVVILRYKHALILHWHPAKKKSTDVIKAIEN